jgi:hypothetical protein
MPPNGYLMTKEKIDVEDAKEAKLQLQRELHDSIFKWGSQDTWGRKKHDKNDERRLWRYYYDAEIIDRTLELDRAIKALASAKRKAIQDAEAPAQKRARASREADEEELLAEYRAKTRSGDSTRKHPPHVLNWNRCKMCNRYIVAEYFVSEEKQCKLCNDHGDVAYQFWS